MNAARFWHRHTFKGEGDGPLEVSIWWGSDVSEADAERLARQAAEEWRKRWREGDDGPGWYAYPDKSHPEPLVDELLDEHGNRVAAVTINRSGCRVLNTTSVPFVDIDLADHQRKGVGVVGRLLGRRVPEPETREELLERLRSWTRRNNGAGARVYRTYAGMRYLITNPPMDPAGDPTNAWLNELGSDPYYTRLCKVQRCFRARLSAKPWRTDLGNPLRPVRYDTYSDPNETELRAWLDAYDRTCVNYSTCVLIEEIGATAQHPDTKRVIELHDTACGVGIDLPLA